jgi:hypothetical protein
MTDEGLDGRKLSIKRNGIQSRCTNTANNGSAARIVDRRGKRSRPPKKATCFMTQKNLRPPSSQKGSSGYPTPKLRLLFSFFPFSTGLLLLLNGVFTSFIFAVHLYIDALGKTRWHLPPACLLTLVTLRSEEFVCY